MHMPKSEQPIKGEEIVIKQILSNPERMILDVGSGSGKWSKELFKKVKRIDGIEAWKPNIDQFNLKNKYDHIYNQDITKFKYLHKYDVIIFGDVFEHIKYEDAIKLLKQININQVIYLILPISLCPQDGHSLDNPYETHQYQWTDKELKRLGFKLLHKGTNKNGLVVIGTYEKTKNNKNEKLSKSDNFLSLETWCGFKYKCYLIITKLYRLFKKM